MNRPEIGNLYFLQAGEARVIKIGWTYGNVTYRVKQLQQSSPEILRWLGATRAPRSAEKEAHNAMAADRHRGEWFYPTQRVLSFVKEKIGGFDEVAYVRQHFRVDLKERVAVLAPYDSGRFAGRLDAIIDDARIDKWTFYRWREQTKLLDCDALSRLEAAINKAENGTLFPLDSGRMAA